MGIEYNNAEDLVAICQRDGKSQSISLIDLKASSVMLGGSRLQYNASPATAEEYSISGTTLTFGAAPTNGLSYYIVYAY